MEEEGEGERVGTTLWWKREEVRGVVPPCGGRGRRGEGWCHGVEEEGVGRGVVPLCGRRRRGEGWYHRVEEEGEGERDGATVWRKGERVGTIVWGGATL